MPGSATATRWPASARSTERSCTWTERTRTRRPSGSTRSSSPSPIDPDHSVPVTTVPIPRRLNERSTKRRVASRRGRRSTRPASEASALRSSSNPSPVRALVSTTGAPGTSSRASSTARARVSTSTESTFVIATTPCSMPSSRTIARCSRVCGLAPSAASTTSRNRSMPVAPATMLRTNRSWPGTSTTESRRPSGSSSGA